MPKYFDPIMQEETLMDETTEVYLVKLSEDKYCIKGVSSGLEKLPSDPTTHATEYWPISIKVLMSLSSNKDLFEDDKLTTKPLKLEQIKEYFAIELDKIPPKKFDISIKHELENDWVEQIMQGEFAQAVPNPNSFFFQPIIFHRIDENNPNQEDIPHHNIPAILLFHMIQQPGVDGAESARRLVVSMFFLGMNHESEEASDQHSVQNPHV